MTEPSARQYSLSLTAEELGALTAITACFWCWLRTQQGTPVPTEQEFVASLYKHMAASPEAFPALAEKINAEVYVAAADDPGISVIVA